MPGLPRLASYINSDPNFAIVRGFGNLHSRVLLHREIELATLEEELRIIDEADQNSSTERLYTTQYFGEGEDKRKKLIDHIEQKMSAYGMLMI